MRKTMCFVLFALLVFPAAGFCQNAKALQRLLQLSKKTAGVSSKQSALIQEQVSKALQQAAAKKIQQQALRSASANLWIGSTILQPKTPEGRRFLYSFGEWDWRTQILNFGTDKFKQVFAGQLQTLYPKGKFTLKLVKNLQEAEDILTSVWYKTGTDAQTALQDFLDGHTWYREDGIVVKGYIIAVVDGKQRPIKDLLFLDLAKQQWWSVNLSRAKSQARRNYEKLLWLERVRPGTQQALHTNGFIFDEAKQMISYDGLHWQPVSNAFKQQVLQWQKDNNFVLFTHKGLSIKKVFENRAAYEAWKKQLRSGK